jgi:uncharacterized membrane protein
MNADTGSKSFDLNRPTIVSLLLLLGAVTGFPTLIAAVLAYMWRGEAAASWESSHFEYHIRGFWITVIVVIVLTVATLVTFGLLFPLFGLVTIWLIIRSVVSLAKAQQHEPMPNPDSLLW